MNRVLLLHRNVVPKLSQIRCFHVNHFPLVKPTTISPSCQLAKSLSTIDRHLLPLATQPAILHSTDFSEHWKPHRDLGYGQLHQISIRTYARDETRGRRSTRVSVADRDREEEEEKSKIDREKERRSIRNVRVEEAIPQADSNQSQLSQLQPGTVSYIRKVYGALGSTIGVAAGASMLSLLTPLGAVPSLVYGLASFIPLFGTIYSKTPRWQMFSLSSFAFLSGLAMGPLIGYSLGLSPWLVPTALALTTGIFGAMSAVSYFAKSKSMLSLGVPLGASLLILLGTGIASIFVPATWAIYPLLHSINLYAGLGIFSLYIAYDTQKMINDYENGQRNVAAHALDFFINFQAIFVRLLRLLGNRD